MPHPLDVPTPELDKRSKVLDKSQAIGEFLEWLTTKGIHLCSIPEEYDHTFIPVHYSIEQILAEFFEIDLDKIEAERRALLEALRS